MKRFLSILIAAALLLSLLPAVSATTVQRQLLDMESLPQDDLYPGAFNSWMSDLVRAEEAKEKGVNGSTALAYVYERFDDSNYWGANLLVFPASGMPTDWSEGDVFWFWVDAGEFKTEQCLEVALASGGETFRMAMNTQYYTWNGRGEALLQTATEAWSGADYSRIPLPIGYSGFIGLPMSAFGNLDCANVENLLLYIEPSGEKEALPLRLYLDEFWLTSSNALPDVTIEYEPLRRQVWDMEALPQTLSASISTWGNHALGEYVDALAAAQKGVNGSTALAYKYLNYVVSGDNGNNVLQISLGDALGAQKDWSGGELLWFWVDASEFETALLLELMLNWTRPALGENCWLWDGYSTPVPGQMPQAWNGADGARIQLPKGYSGFVGVPLTAYRGLNLSDVNSLLLYFEPTADANSLPANLYFDEFWITEAEATPAVTLAVEKVSAPLWNMEALPDLTTEGLFSSWNPYGSCIEAVEAAGKGWMSTTALGYRYFDCTMNSGNDILLINELGALGAKQDWSAGDVLWVWVDASEFEVALRLELWVDWAKALTGRYFYLWDGSNPVETKQITAAWGGNEQFGRMDLPQGYVGWVGVRLADIYQFDSNNAPTAPASFSAISSIMLYFGVTMEQSSLPATLYIDNFWLTDITSTPACAHTRQETLPAMPKTCETDGMTEGVVCLDCGLTLVEQEIIQAGHTAVVDAAVPATCIATGLTEGSHCSVCETVLVAQMETPMGAHTAVTDAAVPATCIATGLSEGSHCSVCETVLVAQMETPMGAHTAVTDAAIPATCTASGLTEGSHCSVCNTALTAQATIAALGHDFGAWVVTTTPTHTASGEQTRTCTRCAATETQTLPATVCPAASFRDIAASAWYHSAVDYVTKNGLMNGVANDRFDPEGTMTRAMLVTVLWRYEKEPAAGANPFTDVEDGRYYTKAIAWAAENGIVNGIGDMQFDPDGAVTREQMAAILHRYAQKKGIDTTARVDFADFVDGTKVSKFAVEPLQWAVAEGIITGSKEGNTILLDPQGNAIRAQVAAVLMRYIENVVK